MGENVNFPVLHAFKIVTNSVGHYFLPHHKTPRRAHTMPPPSYSFYASLRTPAQHTSKQCYSNKTPYHISTRFFQRKTKTKSLFLYCAVQYRLSVCSIGKDSWLAFFYQYFSHMTYLMCSLDYNCFELY